ncbi:hypothetical protein TGME49_328900 [Toxoplasma gondii ME49]|uniref:Uncharacterized protein n=1 Tax=Toxoplasma gondii (strain ATCC 50611 / Me49) TaxID=508771 RepID=S8G861_TOXGM|nr:hypothetical protein TGME49_328900 [Toxoplasma gondii ME49]EPT24429.1 hypothetical protein TGME49_328900 [Toxoplasma gondii ME49]|eukprot:XP_018634671.1 hypothetical protein TGME49_328900 [Toxoplasma gondii ME49]
MFRDVETSVWEMVGRFVEARESVCEIVGRILQASESVWEMVGRIAQAPEMLEEKVPGACESECPAWDAWANPVAEANDPSSLVSEYAACGVWRPHTVLPFSRMSFVAYLRGWAAEVAGWDEVVGGGGWRAGLSGRWSGELPRRGSCQEVVTVWESECPAWDAWANPVAEANDPSSLVSEYAACGVWRPQTVLPFSRMSLVAYLRGWNLESVWEMVGRIAQAPEMLEEEVPGACESECPAWDAWANPVAEANDPSSLVSEYAACGVWRPHTVLPFSRMSLVAYLRGWASESVWEMVGRIAQAPEMLEEKVAGACESECPAWDAWANPVAEANDPSSLVSEYAACGVWRPQTVLPFSRMSLVAYLRGWNLESVWEMVGRIAQAPEMLEEEVPGACESECPAWDAWANPVAEANDPSSLVSEYAACGVWRPHTVLPFSRMSLVAYLRGWASESVWEMVGRIAQAPESVCEIARRILQAAESVWEMLGRIAQARESVCNIVGRILQAAAVAGWDEGVVFRRGCALTGSESDSQRSDVAVARIVDVLGVAAPHGSAGQDARRDQCRWGHRDEALLAGGGGTLRAACPCYICGTDDRYRSDITRAPFVDVLGVAAPHASARQDGDRQRSDITRARSVDVSGVAAPHGPAVVWRRRFSPRYDITLARIVDVLGVAAPHGRAVVCCQEVVTVWGTL